MIEENEEHKAPFRLRLYAILLNKLGLVNRSYIQWYADNPTERERDEVRLITCETVLYELAVACRNRGLDIRIPFGFFPDDLQEEIRKDIGL